MEDSIDKLLKSVKKTASLLRLEPRPDDLPAIASKFGGVPYIQQGEDWPVCTGCQAPLSFICQMDLKETALRIRTGTGFFTLFYCWECAPWGAVDEEPGRWILRLYPGADPALMARVRPPDTVTVTRPCGIRVVIAASYPSWVTLLKIRPDAEHLFAQEQEAVLADIYEDEVEQLVGEQDYYSRVGGYPEWIQDDETPEGMILLAQIESEEDADISWGDAGCAYLFLSPDASHTTRLIVQCH